MIRDQRIKKQVCYNYIIILISICLRNLIKYNLFFLRKNQLQVDS